MAGDKCPWVVHDLSPRLQSLVEYAQPKNISRGIYMYIYIKKVTDDQGPDKKKFYTFDDKSNNYTRRHVDIY